MKPRRAPWHKETFIFYNLDDGSCQKSAQNLIVGQGQVTKEAESTGPVSHGLKLGSKGQKRP